VTYRGQWIVSALLLAAVRVAAETSSGGDGSQTGDGSTRFTGLAQAPEANLFIGAATVQIPFTLPPGRKNLTPQLTLGYNSQGGPSPYGNGWDLSIPRIQRSTMHGVLACNQLHYDGSQYEWALSQTYWDEFVLSLPDGSTPCTRSATGLCVPHLEQSFLKIVFNDASNTWTAWDKSGNRYEFGADQTATTSESDTPTFNQSARTGSDTSDDLHIFPSDTTTPNECTYTFLWALTAIVDPNGNRIDFRYRLLDGMLYPHTIRYGSNSDTSHPFEVKFTWVARDADDQPTIGIGGFPAKLSNRLSTATVSAQGNKVRSYVLAYRASYASGVNPPGKRGRQTFLEKVSLRDGADLTLARADGNPAAAVSAYEETLPGFDSTVQVATKPQFVAYAGENKPNALRWVNNGFTVRDVFDINGDGFADIVDAWPSSGCASNCSWNVYLGTANGFATTATSWRIPVPADMHAIRGAQSKRSTIDLTGDGIADYVVSDAEANPPYWHVYPGTPSTPSGWGFSATYIRWRAPADVVQLTNTPSFNGWSGTAVVYDLLDMTGDGLVDFVDATGSPWEVYPNTGSGFGPPQAFHEALPDLSFSTSNNGLLYGTFDVNGGALPDQVSSGQTASGNYTGSWSVCLNTGHGMATCTPWSVPQFGNWRFIRKSIDSQALDTVRDLFDINADGLPDLVERVDWATNHSWRVHLNRGNGFEQAQLDWYAPQIVRNGSPGGGGTISDTFDVNGDGIVDNVVFDTSATAYTIWHPLGGAWRRSATNSALAEANPNRVRPDLLIESERGNGGVVLVWGDNLFFLDGSRRQCRLRATPVTVQPPSKGAQKRLLAPVIGRPDAESWRPAKERSECRLELHRRVVDLPAPAAPLPVVELASKLLGKRQRLRQRRTAVLHGPTTRSRASPASAQLRRATSGPAPCSNPLCQRD
jgi:hypothetical protein